MAGAWYEGERGKVKTRKRPSGSRGESRMASLSDTYRGASREARCASRGKRHLIFGSTAKQERQFTAAEQRRLAFVRWLVTTRG